MLKINHIKEFYDIIVNKDNYDFGDERLISIDLDGKQLYYNLKFEILIIYYDKITVVNMTKEDGIKLLNIKLRRDKINKLKNEINFKTKEKDN
jgi:hypothetical protein